MTADGKLGCSLPAGRWRIYRSDGRSPEDYHPASPEATGLEVEKLDPDAWMRYFRTYLDLYKDAAERMLGEKGIRYLLVDSYEAGAYTWTPKLAKEFKARRGYESAAVAAGARGRDHRQFPDERTFPSGTWRRTLGELFCENEDRINERANEYDLAGCYKESHEEAVPTPETEWILKIKATIPMAAFWMENTPTGSAVPSSDLRHQGISLCVTYLRTTAVAAESSP